MYGVWRQTTALSLLNWFWILSLLTSQPYLQQSLAPLILPDFCFPFLECLALLCIKDSPSYLTVFFPYLQNIIKGFAGEIEGTVPGVFLQWDSQLCSILDLQGGKVSCNPHPCCSASLAFGGCKSLLVAPTRTLLGTSNCLINLSNSWVVNALYTR